MKKFQITVSINQNKVGLITAHKVLHMELKEFSVVSGDNMGSRTVQGVLHAVSVDTALVLGEEEGLKYITRPSRVITEDDIFFLDEEVKFPESCLGTAHLDRFLYGWVDPEYMDSDPWARSNWKCESAGTDQDAQAFYKRTSNEALAKGLSFFSVKTIKI